MMKKVINFNREFDEDDSDLSGSENNQFSKENTEAEVININQISSSEENININLNTNYSITSNSVVQQMRKLLLALKNNINFENTDKLRNFLFTLTNSELAQVAGDYNKIMPEVHIFIMNNFDKENFYTLFHSYKNLLTDIRNNDNLSHALEFSEDFLAKSITLLDENMKDIIHRQEKLKKTKKNLKNKLRLQRRLNEARQQVTEFNMMKADNVDVEKK